jgi:D-tyrosyl-tRNA(Tyr) deacylase
MRAIVQRVSEASVTIDGKVSGQIGKGFMVLLGIGDDDTAEDATWLCNKIASLRIFSDDEGKMNLDIKTVGGSILLVSQFTLQAKYKKGTRPSFIHAARPEQAIPLYEKCSAIFQEVLGKTTETGEFGAMMDVALVNDGPVTIFLDTKNKE